MPYKHIRKCVEALRTIDTHEHLPHSEMARNRNTDILREYLSHYMSSDVRSAGMPSASFDVAVDPTIPVGERWRVVEPYWEACRFTGYGRALDSAARIIYGYDGVRRNTIEPLAEAFMQALSLGHFERVLKALCRISVSIVDGYTGDTELDRTFFRPAWPGSAYVLPGNSGGSMVYRLQLKYGIDVRTIDDWLNGFDSELADMVAVHGMVALKCTLAYERSLRFPVRSKAEAAPGFATALADWVRRGRNIDDGFGIPEEAGDYIMHHILDALNKRGLVMQVHTGLLEGNGNTLSNADPRLLNDIFLRYRDVKFDLFHIGYPFQHVTTALAKMFPNVFIDMCWAHIISPFAARQALSDFLDAVPYTKISAFGGDYLFPDGVYGHLQMAKDNVSRVLADKVTEGVMTSDTAITVAKALFYDNPKRIFSLHDVDDQPASEA